MSPSTSLIWIIFLWHFIQPSLSTWSFSGTGGSTGEISYSIDVQETITYMNIGYSGTNNWFAIGFGGLTMTDIYVLVFGYETASDSVPTTMDFYLTGRTQGTQQTECSASTCSVLQSYSFANSKTNITVSIAHNSAYTNTFNFGDTLTSNYQLDMIFAAGQQSSLVYAGSTGHCAQCWSTASHINTVKVDTNYKWLTKTQIGTGSGIYLELQLFKSNSTIDWKMYGPTTKWFAVGWGSHVNGDVLIYCDDGSTLGVYDYVLEGTNINSVSKDTQNWDILSNSVISNQRVIHATRVFDTADASDLIFDMTVNSMMFRAAMKATGGRPGAEYELSSHQTNRWTQSVTFEAPSTTSLPTNNPITTDPTQAPTSRPTMYIAPNITVKTFPLTSMISGISLAMKKYQTTGIFEVELYGPIGSWFGIAFDTHFGGNAMIYTTGEDGLDTVGTNVDYSLNGQLDSECVQDSQQDWNVIEISQVSTQQKIIVQRAFNTGDATDDVIDYASNSMTVLVAYSASGSLQLAYHGVNKIMTVVDFQAGEDVTAAPTLSPVTAAPTTAAPTVYIAPNVTVKTFPITTIGADISLAMRKYQSTEIFEVELYGPIGAWFGVAFNSHLDGDALIYTTGKNGLDTVGLNVDYSLNGQIEADCFRDSVQNWNVTEVSQINGTQKLVARRAFNTGDANDSIIDYASNAMTVLVAYGASSSFQFAYHGVDNRWMHSAEFQAGEDVTAAPTLSPVTAAPTTAAPTVYIAPNITVKTFPITTMGAGISLAMQKYQSTEIFEVELYGPINSWFGITFDSHFGGKSLLYTTGANGVDTAGSDVDYTLYGQIDTDCIKDTVQNWNVTEVSQINGKQKLVARRAFNTGDANDSIIDYATNSMTVLVAYSESNTLQLGYHGTDNRWTQIIDFQAGEDVTSQPTKAPSTIAPTTAAPTAYIAANVTVKTFTKTEITGSGMFVALSMNKMNEIFEVQLYGPIGRWFGINFVSHTNGDALIYTTGKDGLDTVGENADYTLKGKLESRVSKDAQQDWNVTEITQESGLQKIVAQRAFDSGDTNDHVIDYNVNTMQLMMAHASTNTLQLGDHGHNNRWLVTIDFESGTSETTSTTTTSTTIRPTHDIPQNVTVKTFPTEEIGYDSGILLGINMYQLEEIFEIELYAPADKWFGIAFGDHYAANAFIYTSNYDGTDTVGISPDYSLKGQSESFVQQDTEQNWNVTHFSVINGTQHIVAHRLFDTGDTDNDYIIDYEANTMDVLVAHAESITLQFSYHGQYSWSTTLDLFSGTSSESSTSTTANTEDDQDEDEDDVDEKVFELTEITDSSGASGIFVAANMRKSTDTYTLTIYGPSNKWFGILWEDHYAGDAFIWLNDDEPDYKASGKEVQHIIKDTIQSWNIIESIEEDGLRKVTATRSLDTFDAEHDYAFDFDTKKQHILVAYSADNSFNLANHALNRWMSVLDFESGELIQLDNISSAFFTQNHAMFMFIGFGFLIPFAIMLIRFRFVFYRWIQPYYIMPIARSCLLIGTISVLIGFIEKIADIEQVQNEFSYHSYGGFGLIVIWMLFMLIYYIVTRRKMCKDATAFNVLICIVFVCLGFAQITSGIIFCQTSIIYLILFAFYAGIYIIIYIVLEIYYFSAKEELLNEERFLSHNSEMMLMTVVTDADAAKDENPTKKDNVLSLTTR